MKIYHTETPTDYNALMAGLEVLGYTLPSGTLPTDWRIWHELLAETCIRVRVGDKKVVGFSSRKWCEKTYPELNIIKYTAKQEGHSMSYEEEKAYSLQCEEHARGGYSPSLHAASLDISGAIQEGISMAKEDFINQPSHYKGQYGLEAIDIIRNFGSADMVAGFYWGNAVKYLTRYRKKNGVEDLKKARKNLDWLIEHEEAGME